MRSHQFVRMMIAAIALACSACTAPKPTLRESAATPQRVVRDATVEDRLRVTLVQKDGEHDIILQTLLENENEAKCWCMVTSRYTDYDIEIKDASGKTIAPTEQGDRQLNPVADGLRHSVPIDSHESLKEQINLSTVFDLPAPGRITLRVSRVVWFAGKYETIVVYSNWLTINLPNRPKG